MKIIKVNTKEQLKQFVRFPRELYARGGPWVCPLDYSVLSMFSREKNPFWAHAERQLFLAYDYYDDNEYIIGRIAGIVDYNYISFHNDKCGFFGFFESIENVEVAKALFSAVQDWLKKQNIHKMMGPMNPSTNDECGFLLKGFGITPSIMMPYTPKYYLELAEACGLKKIKELYAYDMDIVQDSRIERLTKIAKMTKKRIPMLKIRSSNRFSYKKDLKAVMSVYNKAWTRNWGFVPWSEAEFEAIVSKLKMLIDYEMIIMATVGDEPVGMLIALPDYNQVLEKLNGTLFPLGFFKFLFYRDRINSLRLMVMGVVKEYRHKGIEAAMYERGVSNAAKLGYAHCEFSWILDDNIMTQRAAVMMNGRIYKKYAIYGIENNISINQ